MKTLVANQKCLVFTLLTFLILSIGIQNVSYGQANTRTVRLFYFLPNDRSYRQEVVDAMKTGILEVQSFYADQMAAHGHGNMTFRIETDAQGVPIVHRVNGDYSDSHYKDRGRPENEISREFDISSIVQLVVMDISRSSGGRGTGIKQRGQAIIDGRWDWRTAAHELGHAFGLQHDFRDTSYIMSYGSGRNSLSAGAAKYLAVNPYINHSIPLQVGAAPSVQLLSSSQYSYGATSVPVQVRVRDADGLQQVTLFVKTPQGVNLPTGYNEVVSYRNLSGQTDTTVTFNYKGRLPSKGDDDTSLLAQLRHTIYVSAVDKQGNRIDAPPAWTLQPINIQPAKVPVSTRSPRVRDSIYNVVRLFHDRSVSAYDHITDAHLAEIDTLFVNNIELLSSPLQYGDFDGLTNLRTLELRNVTGYWGVQRLPKDMFKGKTLLQKFSSSSYFPFDVRLQKIGTNQFKVVVPTGAPFDIELPLVIANGSINGGATSITIPTGSVESDTYTVTRTPGTTFAVTVDIEKFPSLPTGHEGYGFVKGHADLGPILKIFDALPGSFTHLNDRTPQVRDAIVKAVPEIETPDLGKERRVQIGDTGLWYTETITYGYYANFVTEAHLAAITSLDLSNAVITALKEGDFDGLTNLTTLNLGGNDLRSLIPPIIEGIYLTPIFRKPSEIFDELTNLTTLDLSGNKLSSLPSGVFDELTNLTGLNLANNDLSSLSEDIFDELTNLTFLNLANNDLSSLPAGVFDELTNLTFLNLASNDLSSLPEDIFDELTNMIGISLSENQLSSLPAGIFNELTNMIALDLSENQLSSLSGGIFNQITNLVSLDLRANQLSSLPDGIFEDHFDLSAAQTGYQILLENSLDSTGSESDTLNLTVLLLNDNLVNPIPLTVSLVHVTDDQFKAVAPSGAPFDIVLPLTVTNGTISGSATSITIPTGSVDSQPLTVTRTPGTTAAATVDIGAPLPGLPDGHSGYALVKSVAPPLEFIELEGRVFTPVSERTPEVRDAIVDAVPGVNSAADVTAAHLAAIPSFEVSLGSSVKVGDFDGLTGVTGLGLETGQLTSLPAGLFNDLSNVTYMEWGSQKLITLPVGAFQGFTNLENFGWGAIGLTSLPAGVLDPLTNLTALGITALQLNTLPDGIFDNLTNLTYLGLSARLSTLPDGIFDQLTKLTTLELRATQLTSLPDGILDRLTALTELDLSDNQLSTLPDGLFSGLSSLTKLHLDGNTADPLPLTVSLEKVGVGQFKAVAPAGAPFDLILPINVTDGSINSGVTTLTIPAGSVESDDTLTVSHTPNATEAVAVDIGTLPGLPTSVDRYSRPLHQGYMLVKAVDLPLEFGELGGSVFTPVTDRTPQVRDLIVTAVPDVDSAADVTKAHLAAIRVFWLGQIELFGETGGEEITTLQAGDFDGLTGLTLLWINGGEQLNNVPAGIFNGLSSLEILSLTGNFSNLPEGVFDDVTALTALAVFSLQLNSLPAGVFNELTALTDLWVAGPLNSLPADIFNKLTALTTLSLTVDDTLTLPAGIFEGLTALTDLTLAWAKFSEITPENLEDLEDEDILTDPRPLTVSLEKVGTDQFKAVAPMGAPFEIVLPISVINGSVSGTATTATISKGSVESEVLTVTRTPDTTGAVTVNIGTLPSLPSNHIGYTLVKSADLPLSYPLPEVRTLIGGRTPQVRDAIVAAVPGVNNAVDVTEAHLAAITNLNLSGKSITSLKNGDFEGLTALEELNLYSNQITNLPEDIFEGLTALTTLTLYGNQLTTLPPGIFNGLSSLATLRFGLNQLTTLPADLFDGLTSLTDLRMIGNQLTALPDSIFDGLTGLTRLSLGGNAVDPFPLTVSLEKVADGQFRAVAPTGAPFDIVVPLRVQNGEISGGATSLTITAGSTESEVLTVIRTPGTSGAVSVWIGFLPSLPANHSGYRLTNATGEFNRLIIFDDISEQVWSGTVTGGTWGNDFNNGNATGEGYSRHRNAGSISNPTFTYRGTTYTIHGISFSRIGNNYTHRTSLLITPSFPACDKKVLSFGGLGGGWLTDAGQGNAYGASWYLWQQTTANAWPVGHQYDWHITLHPTMPDAPIVTASNEGNQVMLSWETPCDGGIDITRHEYRQKIGNGAFGPWILIPNSATGEVNATSYTVLNVNNPLESTFEVRAENALGVSLPSAETIPVSAGFIPVSQRTPQVRDAIVAAVPGVNSAAEVTEVHLAAITELDLSSKDIPALKAGDFDGLTALTNLNLRDNDLSSLPAGVFDGLTALTTLYLHENDLTSLLADIFDNNTALTTLYLSNNAFTTLPAGIFESLTALTEINLGSNALSSLPADIFEGLTALRVISLAFNDLSSLPDGIFDGLTALTGIDLRSNAFTTLPAGIFEGLTALEGIVSNHSRFVRLSGNPVDPFPFTVSLQKVADGQFKAVAPAGAPFDIVLPISVTNGSITNGATTLTIPAGSVESDTLTVTRTAGTTIPVTVDIGTLPQLPTSHQGYELVKSADLPLEVMGATATQIAAVNILDANLRAKIESALGKTSGDPITATEMATLTSLTAQDASISNLTGLETATNLTTLKLGNNTISNISALSGLTSLTELHLWDNQLSNISALAGLTNLTRLYLWGNSISDISHLSGLTSLRQLRIGENTISNISAVSRLTNLTYLSVKENAISDISAVSGLTNLAELVIGNNTISDITPIQNLTNLEWLDMPNNSISDISAVQNLTQLVELYFQNNAVSDLSPLVTNTGLRTDDELDVRGNPLSYPSIYTHIPALQARNVYVDFDNRVATAPVKISGDTQQGNTGATLAQPFVVEVQDGSSVAFAGVPVTFAVTAGGGSLSATNTTTDVNGRAQSTLTLGNTAGTNTVSVSVTGITQTITFTATATTTNTAPVFTDGTSTTRFIAENVATGVNIGTAITATDADNDTLIYTLGGTDAAAFNVDSNTGQLKTRNALDYETKTTYMVTVTVTDGSLTDTITVTISVTDIADTAVTSTLTPVSERTLQVREAILGVVRLNFPTISGYDAITKSHLSGITTLYLNNQNITSLKAGDFDDLIGLEELRLNNNQLTTLPDGIFNNLTSLTDINLYNNQLSSLPAGIFEGLTSLTTLRLGRNVVDPFPLTVSLQKAGEGQFKAVVPTGAPFDIALPLSVANGSITGGATTLIISHGSVESDFLTVTATPGTTAAVTVDIRTLPSLPRNHYGYALVKSEDIPLAVISGINTTPTFTEGTRTIRTVAENTAAAVNIGTRITATDAENDTLIYSLSGADASTFDIDSSTGQLKTKAALDYETKANYTVTITVSDGSLTDTITVTINITDIEELPTPTAICEVGDILAPGESCTYPGTDTEFSVLGNGNGQFLFFTSGSSLNIKGTEINGESYTLVAKKLRSGSWEIEEIGDSGDQQPVTREQPGDTGGTPTLTASTAAPLTEATLHEGVITLNLSGGTYEQSSFKIRDAVSVSGITGITLDSFGTERISDTEATVKLEFDGNLNTDGTLTITLGADAIADYDGTALTAQIPVTAVSETIAASTLAPLAEATLDESIITLTLSGRKFESSSSKIRGAVSVSGISGVTVRSLDIDRESDTEITVELTFDGDITTDGTLTFTVGAGAIAGYNGPALTAQVAVSASEAPGEIDDQPPETPQDNTPPPATDTRTTFEASTPPGYTRVTLKKTGTVYGSPTKYTTDSDVGTVAYMALAKLTDCDFADAEVDQRSIVYIKRQSLGQLNNFASESVCGKTSRVWSDAWNAVRITHLRFYDETSLPTIKEAAYNSATDQIKLPSVWQPPGEPTVSDGQDPEPSGQPSGNTDGTPTPTTSTTAPLTEATLNGGVITLSLDDQIYELSVFKIRNAMSVAGIPGVTIDSVERVSDMEIAVALTFNGNIDTDATLTFTVDAGAIVDYTGPAFTAQTSVPAVTESIVASTAAPLTEATLDESVVTLTLSGRKYERFNSTIRPAVSVSGISGVTVGTFDIDRESDMEITVELTFDGDITTDGTLTFTVGAGAIAGYNGPTLTAQVSVSASTDAPDDTTPATVDTTPVEDDTTPGVCKVGDVLAPGESCTYPGTDTEFSVLGNGNGQFLFFTSGSSLNIKGTEINGESYTLVAKKLRSGSWEIEEIGDSSDQQPETPQQPVTPQQPGDKDPPEQPDNNTGGTPTLSVTTAAPLTEATLHEGVITFNLSDGTFDHSKFTIRDAITLTGISGVTADAFGVDRVSDTEATVELAFDGNMTSDSNLTISLGAGAIKDYDGTALTSQLSVSAVTESVTASTAAPLTETTLDESVVTLTLSGRKYERFNSTIRPAVSVSGISGVTVGTFDIDRESDTEITVELTFNGDITTDGTLTFTVGADAIAGYNGPALTAQVSVSAGTETPVVTDGQTPVTPQQPGDKDPPEQPDNNTGGTPTLSVTTAAPLTEATLHGGIITFNLSDGTFERNKFTIRDAITLTGISGVTADAFGVDRVSDTRVTVELAFAGNMTSDSNLTISLGVDAIKDYDGAALTAQMSVSAVTESVTASTAAPLTEATLDESVVTLTLSGRKYERWNSTIRPAVSVSGISGVTVGTFDIDRESDTEITVELTFDGDITVDGTLTFTVGAGAITGYNGPALTVQVSVSAGTETPVVTDGQTPVTPQQPGDKDPPEQPDNNTGGTPTLSITTAAPLTEATLHEGVITLNLSGGTFERSSFSIRDAITLSGISGVTVDTFGVDRVSDTKVTVELAFDGNMTTDSTLTISVGAGAIKDYNGTALTSQISVRAITESMAASTASPLTEATLDESIVTLTLNGAKYARSIFDIRGAVSVSGISGVTKPWSQPDRKSDTEVTVELEFDGTDFDTTSTLTFTVEADAIAGYNGPALTTQISVSAVTESVVASTPAPLKEATLDGSVVTLTLSGAKYSGSIWDIRGGVTVSGITGVTIPWNQPDRKSDTQITIELEFDGNMNTDGTLTFTVGANAIENYSGSALTTQVTVTADRENVLLANFPNPFNPETWIPYQLAKPTDVTITIYALNGQVVRTLALGHQVTGMYQSRSRAAYWDGRNEFGEKVASGLYFYTLTAGNFTATRKMLIRK